MASRKTNPKKTAPRMDAQRAQQALQARGYVLARGLTIPRVNYALEQFALGYLREAAIMWQQIKDRDDTVLPVSLKRELDPALLDYEILTVDDSPEAGLHKEALEAAYNNLTATHALIQDQRGGVSTLIQQMMHAIGHRYAPHEIVWRPQGADLTADFHFVPLQFFEATTGRLRFLPTHGASTGEDLEPGGWMVTVGPGLMQATSIAAVLKQLPLKAWLLFCDKAGMPGLHGETDAAFGSEEWENFRTALASFGEDWALVTSRNAKINTIDLKAGGELPHPPLVDRMDRAISRIWRGNDLGTMSRQGEATGSNPQESETDILAAADPILITETLQHYFDRWVIRYRFGAEPKAYFQLKVVKKINHELELKIDDALIKWGVPRAKNDLLSKYGRPEPDDGEELATAPANPVGPDLGPAGMHQGAALQAQANEAGKPSAFDLAARQDLTEAQRRALAGPLGRLRDLLEIEDEAELRAAAEKFQAELPAISRPILTDPATAKAWQEIIGTAVVSGFFEAATGRTSAARKSQSPNLQTPNKS